MSVALRNDKRVVTLVCRMGIAAALAGLALGNMTAKAQDSSPKVQGPKAEAGAGAIRSLVDQATVNGGNDYPGMGFRLTSAEGIARSAKFKITRVARGERPKRVVLTDWLPPVGDQGNQGSCAGWATAYYCYTYSVAKQRKLTAEQRRDPRFQFSPAFLYHKVNGGVDSGSKMRDIFDVLGNEGCASLAEMPYSDKDLTSAPSSDAVNRAARYKARSVGCLFTAGKADVEALKTYLAEVRQPFVAAIPIFTDFPKGKRDDSFVYSLTVPAIKANFKGGHAITIVGYDEDKKAFRMVNSWGPDWGDGGFIWLSEDFIKEWGLEGWAQAPGGVIARDVVKGAPLPEKPIRASKSVLLEPAAPAKTPRRIKR
jgi:hypothetical protein